MARILLEEDAVLGYYRAMYVSADSARLERGSFDHSSPEVHERNLRRWEVVVLGTGEIWANYLALVPLVLSVRENCRRNAGDNS